MIFRKMNLTLVNYFLYKTLLMGFILVSLIMGVIFTGTEIALWSPNLIQLGWTMNEISFFFLLRLPTFYSNIFPAMAAIGALIGLLSLAQHNELTLLKSMGVSRLHFMGISASVGIFIGLSGVILSGYIAPIAYYKSDLFRQKKDHDNKNAWLVNGNYYSYIGKSSSKHLDDINIFLIRKNYLLKVFHAKNATLNKAWILEDVSIVDYSNQNKISKKWVRDLEASLILPADILTNGALLPDELNLNDLHSAINYRKKNHLNSSGYELRFWQIILLPISVVLMMLLAVSFIFRQSISHQMVINIIYSLGMSLAFYFFNQLLTPIVLIYNWPPLLAAAFPTSIIIAILGTMGLFIKD